MKAALIILSGIVGASAAGAVALLYVPVDPNFPAPVLFGVLLGAAFGAGVAVRMLGRDISQSAASQDPARKPTKARAPGPSRQSELP